MNQAENNRATMDQGADAHGGQRANTMIAPSDDLALQSRQDAWSKFALEIYNAEQKLQLSCSALVNELQVLPATIDDLPQAEALIKRVKADWNLQIEIRKSKTKKFDALTARLMNPEKSVMPEIAAFEAQILKLKKEQADKANKARALAAENARLRELFTNHISQSHANISSLINMKVSRCFEKCLTDGIAESDLPFDKMKASLTLENFKIYACPATSPLINDDDVIAIWMELHPKHSQPPTHYLEMFHFLLKKQFEFYNVALKNKEQSLALAKLEAAKKEQEIEATKQSAVVAAKLETLAVPATASFPSGKQIKEVYRLSMEDNENNALIILTAFASNWNLCKSKLRVKSMFALSINQMGTALEAIKNQDKQFNVSGLVWKLEDKL